MWSKTVSQVFHSSRNALKYETLTIEPPYFFIFFYILHIGNFSLICSLKKEVYSGITCIYRVCNKKAFALNRSPPILRSYSYHILYMYSHTCSYFIKFRYLNTSHLAYIKMRITFANSISWFIRVLST